MFLRQYSGQKGLLAFAVDGDYASLAARFLAHFRMNLSHAPLSGIGLGHVGLPLAVEFGKRRKVLGFEINVARIAQWQRGHGSTLDVDAPSLAAANQLRLNSAPEDLKPAESSSSHCLARLARPAVATIGIVAKEVALVATNARRAPAQLASGHRQVASHLWPDVAVLAAGRGPHAGRDPLNLKNHQL